MTEELLNAAIMRLRSKAVEYYGLTKLLYNSPPDETTVDKICAAAMELVKYEGAMITLQQYSAEIVKSQDAPTPEPEPEPENYVGHDELMERSPTYKKSMADAEMKQKATRRRKKKS